MHPRHCGGEGIAAVEVGGDRDSPVEGDGYVRDAHLGGILYTIAISVLKGNSVDDAKAEVRHRVAKVDLIDVAQCHTDVDVVGGGGDLVRLFHRGGGSLLDLGAHESARVSLDDGVFTSGRGRKEIVANSAGRGGYATI